MCCWSDFCIPSFCSSRLSWFPHASPFPFISCLISKSEPQNMVLSSFLLPCLNMPLQHHRPCYPESWDCPLPHGSIIPTSCSPPWQAGNCRTVGQKSPDFVSTCVSPGVAQASLAQVIASPQVVYLLSTQHPLLWDWPEESQSRGKLFQQSQTS